MVWELSVSIVEEEDRARRERLRIPMAYAMGRPPKRTEDGHIFVSSNWRDYLDAQRW